MKGVTKTLTTVSLFGVPTFVSDNELTEKLLELGCIMKGEWTHKTYNDYPGVENGIRFVRLELPSKAKSLPYVITVGFRALFT